MARLDLDIAKVSPQFLEKEIRPFGLADFRQAGLPIVENPDPILRWISIKGEETYKIMERSEPAIFAAKQNRINTLLGAGSEVHAGPSGSPLAEELKEWTIAFLKRIPMFTTVQRKMLDAWWLGWRPLEMIWETDAVIAGRLSWGIVAINEQDPTEFRFTTDRDLAWIGPNGAFFANPIIFDRPEDSLKWLVCTSGSTANPYGEAVAQKLWLPWFMKNRFIQIMGQGMERSVGILKARKTSEFDADGKRPTIDEVKDEIRDILELLSANNILVERGWTLELISDVNFTDSLLAPLKYLDEHFTTSIIGQTLTTRAPDSGGSRAAAQVHRLGLLDFVKSDAKELGSWINDQIICPAILLNFPGDIAEDDLPKWRAKVLDPVDLEAAQRLFDMGAPLDGKHLAREAGVKILLEPGPDDLVLKKQAAPNPLSLMPGGFGNTGHLDEEEEPEEPEEKDPEEEEENRSRLAGLLGRSIVDVISGRPTPEYRQVPASVMPRANVVEATLDREVDKTVASSEAGNRRFVDELREAWLRTNPDPSE